MNSKASRTYPALSTSQWRSLVVGEHNEGFFWIFDEADPPRPRSFEFDYILNVSIDENRFYCLLERVDGLTVRFGRFACLVGTHSEGARRWSGEPDWRCRTAVQRTDRLCIRCARAERNSYGRMGNLGFAKRSTRLLNSCRYDGVGTSRTSQIGQSRLVGRIAYRRLPGSPG